MGVANFRITGEVRRQSGMLLLSLTLSLSLAARPRASQVGQLDPPNLTITYGEFVVDLRKAAANPKLDEGQVNAFYGRGPPEDSPARTAPRVRISSAFIPPGPARYHRPPSVWTELMIRSSRTARADPRRLGNSLTRLRYNYLPRRVPADQHKGQVIEVSLQHRGVCVGQGRGQEHFLSILFGGQFQHSLALHESPQPVGTHQ